MNNTGPARIRHELRETNQAMMQHLATTLLTGGDQGREFSRYAQVIWCKPARLPDEMSDAWVGTMMDVGPAPILAEKERPTVWQRGMAQSRLHNFLKDSYLINTRYVKDLDRSFWR